jgi:hypothetical protein
MQRSLSFLCLGLLASSVWAGDTVITKQKHADAGMGQPAKDSTEVVWIGVDRMRVEDGSAVTIVRADLKKMFMLDTSAKSCTTVDLPFDMKKYMPPEMAGHMDQMSAATKATLTPTGETKQIQGWNATKVTLAMTLPMGGSMTQEMWVTKDVGGERRGWADLFAAQNALGPFAAGLAAEMKKVDGLALVTETSTTMMGQTTEAKESVTSIEEKDAPAGHYDVPSDYTHKNFDPLAGMTLGGGHGARKN